MPIGLPAYTLLCGDALQTLRTLPGESVHCVVTSPPYFSLRSYLPSDHPDKAFELGAEATPEQFVANLVAVFAEVKRVLHPSGTLFLNLGDSYVSHKPRSGSVHANNGVEQNAAFVAAQHAVDLRGKGELKDKDLIGIPWMVAFALRADGWYLRSAITWCKGNPMPESVSDRCTSATEMVFMLAKNERYFYDQEAIREEASPASIARISQANFANQTGGPKDYRNGVNPSRSMRNTLENFAKNPGRNKRNWWLVNSEPYPGSHYAVMPSKLVEPCILSGTSAHGVCAKCLAPYERQIERVDDDRPTYKTEGAGEWANGSGRNDGKGLHKVLRADGRGGDLATKTNVTTGWAATCQCQADVVPATVLDCFFGSGTVIATALKFGRSAIGIDLDARNIALAKKRIEQTQPLLFNT